METLHHKALHNDEKHENLRRPRRPVKKIELDTREKRRLKDYFEHRATRQEVVTTTRTPLGQILDWVPIESQIRKGKIAKAPPDVKLRVDTRGARKMKLTTFELEHPDAKRGPQGTVPILRKDPKKLVHDKLLRDLLSKHGHRTRTVLLDGWHSLELPEVGSPHDYASTAQNVTCYGGDGYISAYDPYTWYSDEFSLGQIALIRGSGNGMQTVEAGHQEYRDLYGDWVPHLFIFYTTNNYTDQGDNKGGYNRDVDGWVQYSNSIFPGAISSPTSTPGGAQYNMFIKYQLYQGNWWLNCNSNWIGYYPASLFSTSGLRSRADQIQFFGEIVDASDHSAATGTDMGSGYWAENRWPWSGFQRNLRYQSNTNGAMSAYNAGSCWATDSNEYDIECHMNSGTSWGSYFWFGGPGAG